MNTYPAWLPLLLELSGEWEDIIVCLYEVFETDFIRGRPTFERYPVWWDRRILPGDTYEEGFWHLITKDDPITKERLPDWPRAKRLPWCAPTIRNSKDIIVKDFDYLESNGKIRTYLWLENLDFAVILEKRQKRWGWIAFLITAFYIDGESRRRYIRCKYNNRCS